MWMGEHINRLANKHWQSFSRQNYFDRRGVFFGAVVGLPLLVTMFIILVRKWSAMRGWGPCSQLLLVYARARVLEQFQQHELVLHISNNCSAQHICPQPAPPEVNGVAVRSTVPP
jgi:hypothetical protein